MATLYICVALLARIYYFVVTLDKIFGRDNIFKAARFLVKHPAFGNYVAAPLTILFNTAVIYGICWVMPGVVWARDIPEPQKIAFICLYICISFFILVEIMRQMKRFIYIKQRETRRARQKPSRLHIDGGTF